MFRATIRSLLNRKLRLILSTLAVVLGVMFVSGAFVLTDTIGRSFDALFTTAYSTVDVQIIRTPRSEAGVQDASVAEPVPASLIDDLEPVTGIRKITGTIILDGARVISPNTGKIISGGMGVPNFGGNWTGEDDLVKLRQGRGPSEDTEVVINASLAKAGTFSVGSQIEILLPATGTDDPTGETTQSRRRTFTVCGIFGYAGGRDSVTGETYVAFTTPAAQRLMLGTTDAFSEIDILVADGSSPTAVRDAIRDRIGPDYRVNTGKDAAKEQSDFLKDQLKFFNYILLGFATIALFVGIFIILNTFSIIVAQRMRELALMRAIGASRRQVLVAVLLEAGILGLIASGIGLLCGIGVGAGLAAAAVTFIEGMELAGLGVPLTAVIASFGVGIPVTLIAALIPAVKASRIAPIAALQESTIPDKPLTRLTIGGIVVTLAGNVALALGLTDHAGGHELLAAFAGILTTFVGIALLTPIIARPAVSALGRLLAWSTPGELGRRNTARNPRRTAITAAALMVGVALVTAISTLFSSATVSTRTMLDETLHADLLVYGIQTGQNPPTFHPNLLVTTRQQADVEAVAGYWYDVARSDDGQTMVSATDDLAAFIAISGSKTTQGRGTRLAPGEIVIDSRMAKEHHLTLGSTVRYGLTRADDRDFTVIGIYQRNEIIWGPVLSIEDAQDFRARDPQLAFINLRDGANVEAMKAMIDGMLVDSPDISVVDRSGYLEQQTSMLNMLLGFIQVLLALAMVIAVLGVINTLILSIFERTRELGLLRAVGLSRAQTTRMITVEAVVISLFGALLGIVVGAGLGAAVVQALRDEGYTTIAFPYGLMAIYLALAALVGVIAAVFPAARASRLNVLTAIAHE
ncbi:MAG: ABC transporter permease [Micromonosporaceae bacterium]|nr:ABC transporter permease [Micromonosporaceae bacterium]